MMEREFQTRHRCMARSRPAVGTDVASSNNGSSLQNRGAFLRAHHLFFSFQKKGNEC